MQITINITDYLKNDKSLTYWSLQRMIITKIVATCNKAKTKEIITNLKLGSVLADCVEYTQNKIMNTLSSNGETYSSGSIYHINVMIDPNMKWDDTRIILIPSLQKKRENKLLRIFREKVTKEVTEIIIIDKESILI